MDHPDRLPRFARIGEIEAALGIDRQIIRLEQRMTIALGRSIADELALRIQVEHGAAASIADQVRAVGQNLVAIGRARLGPDRFLAIQRDTADESSVRHVGVSARIERNSLRMAPKPGYFNRTELLDR